MIGLSGKPALVTGSTAGIGDAIAKGRAADVSAEDGCKPLTAALPDVDVLINNAGICGAKDFFEIAWGTQCQPM
jgi:NAD(P)-dependent dehydrogenase (short-subunit alcohol dehydrogenase family)